MKSPLKCRLAAAVLAASLPVGALSATIYVDAAFAGAEAGTLAAPYNTIAEAITAAAAGDTIQVAAGTYQESLLIPEGKDGLQLLGPNADTSAVSGTVATLAQNTSRAPEAIIVTTSVDTVPDYAIAVGTSTWVIRVNANSVRIAGFTINGDNPAVNGGISIVASGAETNADLGIFVDGLNRTNGGGTDLADDVLIENNRVLNITAYGIGFYNRADNGTVRNNYIAGQYYTGAYVKDNGYANFTNNLIDEAYIGFQSNNIWQAGIGGSFSDNRIKDFTNYGIFHNLIYQNASPFTFQNNVVEGTSRNRTTGVAIVSNGTAAGQNIRATLAGNTVRNAFYGFQFQNNLTTQVPRIQGGLIENIEYGAVFLSRSAAQGKITVSGIGNDYTGGPATWDIDEVLTPGAPSPIPFTGQVVLPPTGNETGCSPFAPNYFAGGVAILELQDNNPCGWIDTDGDTVQDRTEYDLRVPALNAQNAGASAVIFVNKQQYISPTTGLPVATLSYPPSSPYVTGETDPADNGVAIPCTMIAERLYNKIVAQVNGGTATTVTVEDFYLRNSTFNIAEEQGIFASTTTPSRSELVGVRIVNANRGCYYLWDVDQVDRDRTGTPKGQTPVIGKAFGGSELSDSTVGVVCDGPDASLELIGTAINDNEVGALITNGGSLELQSAVFRGNSLYGIQITSGDASLVDGDFVNHDTAVQVEGDPNNVNLIACNFDAAGRTLAKSTGVRNTVPGSGTVQALDNYWGDATGPDDDAGVFNGNGAIVSTGVNLGTPRVEPFLVEDTDGDGLSDAVEISLGTNPNLADTDGDGIVDSIEVANGTDPLVAATPGTINTADLDGDGLIAQYDPNDNERDSDGDGISDFYEVSRGADPANAYSFPPFGDANSDGILNNADAVLILEAFLGITDFRYIARGESDINRDGLINNIDAVILYNFAIGNIPYIPFP
ncbi:DUF1565 domain-containing protein [bacterium]|nr:DUF1565 domain-containing protein [bacterium]